MIALVVVRQGTATAKSLIGTLGLVNDAVTTAKLRNGAVTSVKIKDGTIAASDIAPGVIPQAGSVANAAALGGKPASAYYDAATSDSRFLKVDQPAADSSRLGGIDFTGWVRGGGNVDRTERELDPTPGGTPTQLFTIPDIGSFAAICDSTAGEARLTFTRHPADNDPRPGVEDVALSTERIYDAHTADAKASLGTRLITTQAPSVFHVAGDSAQARFDIVANRVQPTPDGNNVIDYQATVHVAETYKDEVNPHAGDSPVLPGKCLVLADYSQLPTEPR